MVFLTVFNSCDVIIVLCHYFSYRRGTCSLIWLCGLKSSVNVNFTHCFYGIWCEFLFFLLFSDYLPERLSNKQWIELFGNRIWRIPLVSDQIWQMNLSSGKILVCLCTVWNGVLRLTFDKKKSENGQFSRRVPPPKKFWGTAFRGNCSHVVVCCDMLCKYKLPTQKIKDGRISADRRGVKGNGCWPIPTPVLLEGPTLKIHLLHSIGRLSRR